jgi:hypothetical protein
MSAFNVPFCKCGDCLATGLGGHGKVSSKLGNLSSASMDGFNSHHHHKSTPLNGTGTLNNSVRFPKKNKQNSNLNRED